MVRRRENRPGVDEILAVQRLLGKGYRYAKRAVVGTAAGYAANYARNVLSGPQKVLTGYDRANLNSNKKAPPGKFTLLLQNASISQTSSLS